MSTGDCPNDLDRTSGVTRLYWGSEFYLVILILCSYLNLFRRLILK